MLGRFQRGYEPGRFLRRRLVRRKYVQRGNPEIATWIKAVADINGPQPVGSH
jgi:hypothetical protein